MKKITNYCLFLIALCCIIACSSVDKSPSEEVVKYIEYIESNDYQKFEDVLSFDKKLSSKDIKRQKELVVTSLKQKHEKNGGIKNLQLVSEVKSQDGKKAKVIIILYYKDESNESVSYNMVKEKGSWKIKIEE